MLPEPSDSFLWTQEPWGPALRCGPLLDAAPHVFTTRAVSVSRDPVDPDLANVASSLGLAPSAVVQAHQVHGNRALILRDGAGAVGPLEGDALITDDCTCGVGVRTADCAPILLATRSGEAVAAIHAGWRGTAAGVAGAAVAALERELGCAARDLVVAIGPLIRACCYEVGPDTRAAFTQYDSWRWFSPGRGDRLQLDVAAANRDQLVAAGVPSEHIHDSRLCTACHLGTFHSYRKEGRAAGRLFAGIRPSP